MQCGAQGVGRGVACAGDQAVGVAHLDHHGAKVGGVVHLLACLGKGDALLGAKLGELGGIILFALGSAGVDNGGAGNVDLCGVAQDDEVGKAFLDNLLGSLDGAGVLTLGKNDGLLVCLGSSFHTVQEIAHVSPRLFAHKHSSSC